MGRLQRNMQRERSSDGSKRAGRGEEASNGDGSTRGMVLEDDIGHCLLCHG